MTPSIDMEWLDSILRTLLREGYELSEQEYGIYGGYKEVEKAKAAIAEQVQQMVAEAEKAYGGCHNCYGKGYATVIDTTIAHADFGDELGGSPSRKTEKQKWNGTYTNRLPD